MDKLLIERNTNKIKLLKETFLDWALRVHVDCFVKIFKYENRPFVQLIWVCILLVSSCLTFFIINQRVQSYLEFGVTSQISVVYETPTEFPAVTFCDINAFTTLVAQNTMVNVFVNNNLTIRNRADSVTLTHLAQMLTSDPAFGDENRKLMGLNMSQMVYCIYNSKDCTADLHWYWSYDYGNCFQFNVGLNSHNQKIAVEKSSLEDLNNRLIIQIFPLKNDNFILNGNDFGMVAFIHNSSFKPTSSDGVFLKAGVSNYISVKRTFLSNPPKPYTDCVDLASYSSDLYDFILGSNQTYRQKDCFDLCKQTSIIDACGCYFTGFANPRSRAIRACSSIDDLDCITNKLNYFDSISCASLFCPLECETIVYDTSLSHILTPTYLQYYLYTQHIEPMGYVLGPPYNFTYEEYRNHFLRFYVFYPTLEYTKFEVTPCLYLADLLASIGGSMGLIVSLSFFTLFELIELIILIVHGLFFKYTNKVGH